MIIKELEDFPGYWITKSGRVFSMRSRRFLKPKKHKFGHLFLTLMKDNKRYNRYIHRLVLETFIGPQLLHQECRHLDGNPSNNHLFNLCWGSRVENAQDRIKHGRGIGGVNNPNYGGKNRMRRSSNTAPAATNGEATNLRGIAGTAPFLVKKPTKRSNDRCC